MADDEQGFRAEYAKSGRSSCRGCSSTIEKDSLRLAVMVQSHHFDGKEPKWHHFRCFWLRARPQSHTEFSGFDNLRWEDQKQIKEHISSGGGSSAAGSKAKGKKVVKSAAVSDLGSSINYKDYSTEYAKTGKSKCRGCEDFIPKGEVRVSKKDYDSQRAKAYGPQDSWYHVDCFVKIRDELEFGNDKDIKKISQFPCLKKEDKDMLLEKFGKPTKAVTLKRKAEATVGEAVATKVAKTEESAEEKELKEQNEAYWKCRDILEKHVSNNALKGLLIYNKQELPAGEQRILNRLADCMTFGALDKCPECKLGQLVFSSTGYVCQGNISEWTKCQYITKLPKRHTFKVHEDYHDVEYLAKYKCVKKVRLFPKDGAAVSSAAAALHVTKAVVDKTKPLLNMKIVIIGKVKDKKKTTAGIKELGGIVATKIDLDIALCISTKEEVDSDSKKINEARNSNIKVVSEKFIEEVKDGDLQKALKATCLSAWGDSCKPVAANSAKAKKSARDEAMFTKSVPSKMKMTVKDGSVVDPESGLQKGYHVLKVGKDLYSEVLNMVDVAKGTNSYYKLQLLESDSGSSYYVYRAWGRVGTTIGGDKKENFRSKQSAIDNYKEVYEEKTGNEWEDRANFQKHPHKFYPIEMDYGQNDSKIKSLNTAGANSKLAKPVQEIIKMIFDVESMQNALVEFEIDLKKMPLGKISKKQIEKAYSVLTEVQNLLKSGGSATKFLDCSNRFYTLIPHDFGMQKPPLLDNETILRSKTDMLDNLLEIEVAYNLLKSSENSNQDPIDFHYEQLKTEIDVLDKSGDEYKRLSDYVKNTHGETHNVHLDVEDIFVVKRQKEAARYKPFKRLDNRMLLWHGSRTTNFAGILSQGLRIAPPEAPVTGYMFGKGIYFADMVTKSANYCHTSVRKPLGLMLLCEVALGTMYERTRAEMVTKLPNGFHSCKGVGSMAPDPSGFHTASDGVIYPMGKGQQTTANATSLLYNEYIVYDAAQVNIKYLLKLRFKQK